MSLIPTAPANTSQDYRRRMALKLMMEGSDASPVQHWAQGLARLGQGALGGYEMYQADQKDKADEADATKAYATLLGGATSPAAASTPAMPTPSRPLPPQNAPMASADPVAATGPRPGGPVMPTGKVWGDAEAEAAGLYEPSKNVKLASALSQPEIPAQVPMPKPAAPQMAQALTQPVAAQAPPPDAQKDKIIQFLQSDKPEERRAGRVLADQYIAQQFKPAEWDFKQREDGSYIAINKRNPNIVQAVPGSGGGQDAIDFKAREAAAKEAATIAAKLKTTRSTEEGMSASFDDTSKLRGELSKLPSYQNISQAAPIYKSMHDAAGRNTKAADLNMVYGLGKIMDPGSVVREGEIHMANNAQGWQEKLNGIIGQINGQGGLTPQGREALMAEAHSRMQSYKQMYDQDAERFRGIAQRNRANPADVVHDFGEFTPWTAPKAAAAPASKGSQGAVPPAPKGVDAKIWQHMTPEERALWK